MTNRPLLTPFFFVLALFCSLLLSVPSKAEGPTISRVSPDKLLNSTTGNSVNFIIDGKDSDGNLRGAEWYGNPASPSKVMLTIVPKTHAARMNRTIAFPDPGNFKITVSAFDTDYNYSNTTEWDLRVSPPSHVNPLDYRALYVDAFDKILGDSRKEQELLDFLKDNGFSEIAIYGLNPIFRKDSGYTARCTALRSFLTRAKASYGLKAAKGIGSLNSDFDDICEYNDASGANEKFSGMVTEYEYWNGDTDFNTYITMLAHMRSLADARSMTVETYLGWLGRTGDKQDEANRIAALADVVYLHAYRADPFNTYSYISERLALFATAKPGLRIRPIFSAEWRPLEICSGNHKTGVDNYCFMGKWYESNPIRKAENIFMDFYYFHEASLPAAVTMDGYQYFAYSFLKEAIDEELGHLTPVHYLLLSRKDFPGISDRRYSSAILLDGKF